MGSDYRLYPASDRLLMTLHVQTVGYKGKDALMVTLKLANETDDWLHLDMGLKLTLLTRSTNKDRLEGLYFQINEGAVKVYKDVLTETSPQQIIVNPTSRCPAIHRNLTAW